MDIKARMSQKCLEAGIKQNTAEQNDIKLLTEKILKNLEYEKYLKIEANSGLNANFVERNA